MERLTIRNSDGSHSQPTLTPFYKLFYKVAEYEDFMEDYGFENIDQVKKKLGSCQSGPIYEVDLKSQIKQLKSENKKWEQQFVEFKEYLEKKMASNDVRICDHGVYTTVYNKLLRVKGGLHDRVR